MVSEEDERLSAQYVEEAQQKILAEEFEGAIADCNQALIHDPENTLALGNRGIAKNELNQFEEAIRDFDQLISLKPEDAEGLFHRGKAKQSLGKYVEAIRDYDKSIEIHPNVAETFINRGFSKGKLGSHTEAISDFDQAIAINPESSVAFNNRGFAKDVLGDHEGAIKDSDEAIRLNPTFAEAYSTRGAAKGKLERFDEAIVDLNHAISIQPEKAHSYANRAIAKASMKKFDEAIEDIQTAISINPDKQSFINTLATIKAEKEIIESVNERVGTLREIKDYLRETIVDYENREKWSTKMRNVLIAFIAVLLPCLMVLALFWDRIETIIWPYIASLFCEVNLERCCKYTFCKMASATGTTETDPFTLLLRSFGLVGVISAPFFMFLRIYSRNAEEAHVMKHDYRRMLIVESRINELLPAKPEKQEKLYEELILVWLTDSPIETLLRMKKRISEKVERPTVDEMRGRIKSYIDNNIKPEDST